MASITNMMKKWKKTNRFKVSLENQIESSAGGTGIGKSITSATKTVSSWFGSSNAVKDYNEAGTELPGNDDLNASIVSVDIPGLSDETIVEWQSGRWFLSPGRISVPEMSITFRDSFDHNLYRYFREYLENQYKSYYSEITWNIRVETLDGAGAGHLLFECEGILTNVSQVQLSQENDQVMEFTAGWKLRYNDKNVFERIGNGASNMSFGGLF